MASAQDVDEAKYDDDNAAGGDLINGLCDDVLLRILELVEDSKYAARAGAQSRRWRGLWARVPSLRFYSDSAPRSPRRVERFIAFVDNVLALRERAGHGVELLAISLRGCCGDDNDGAAPPSLRAAERWIRLAARRGVERLAVDVNLRPDWRCHQRGQIPVIGLANLPSSAKLQTMCLRLGGATVRLPAAAAFPSLADLTLEKMEVQGKDGHLRLARLLSTARCPRLQKLRMGEVKLEPGQHDLVLDAGALSELSLEYMSFGALELRTPELRALRINCGGSIRALTVSAPRLEEFEFLDADWTDDIAGDFSSVRSLRIDSLTAKAVKSISFLQRCSSLQCLGVSLRDPWIDLHRLAQRPIGS